MSVSERVCLCVNDCECLRMCMFVHLLVNEHL